MLEDITSIDLKILSLYISDYAASFSIREITQKLNINYSHSFKRIKILIEKNILLQKKQSHVNHISLNIKNFNTLQLISFVEEQESQKLKNSTLKLLIKEVIQIDPFACMGIFGSRVSKKSTKNSDWDVFIITQKTKEMSKIMSKFPHVTNIELQVFSLEEFQDSLLTSEETVVKQIVRNKRIIYNPHPFYNIIYNWEMIKYAPTQSS
ncbi:hypothetical protein CL616_04530 [archaeon]|nr:hypothetical protein [archaeon]|tara:strand:- start:722 stop:1345 length:624 start_codon:yes stop_codon:yes gene_type:complete